MRGECMRWYSGQADVLRPATTTTRPLTSSPLAKPVIGLIGGIGSGKSLVAATFARRGARVISGDELGHEAPAAAGDPCRSVVQRWGPEVLDEQGRIDRRRLGAIVFADPSERRALEAMVFPWIERRIREEIDDARKRTGQVRLIVLDAAVMLEAGWNERL